MKSIDELDHYELLEISPSASAGEIDRAYRLAQQIYADGSLALYSVFEDLDAKSIRSRLDEAYQVLSDSESRETYDRNFDFGSQPPSGVLNSISDVATHFDDAVTTRFTDSDAGEVEFASFDEGIEEYDGLEGEGGSGYDGVRLRRTRLFRGYEIEDIAEVTKVNGNHLRNIENENFEDLPADVYVRGFVTAYAKTIGLDPAVVVPAYMARVSESREGSRRGGFLGRL